jgi:hypothetical protein
MSAIVVTRTANKAIYQAATDAFNKAKTVFAKATAGTSTTTTGTNLTPSHQNTTEAKAAKKGITNTHASL